MKMALIRKVDFIRSKNYSIAFISELGACLSEGDLMEDVANARQYRVVGRSVSIRRSEATESLLAWSREASIVIEGKCSNLVGRILFEGPSDLVSCIKCECMITDRDGELPRSVPIVGAIRLDDYDCPAVLVIGDDLSCQIAFVGKKEVSEANTLTFVAQNPDQRWVHVGLMVESWRHAETDGEIISLGHESETVEYV
jgi:hypothetical protein